MENTLRTIETEEIVIYRDFCYSEQVIEESIAFFNEMKEKGVIKGEFKDNKWFGYSGVKSFGIDFAFDKKAYEKHIGNEFGITYSTMQLMIKCYALYCTGQYIFQTISKEVVGTIVDFICNYKEKSFKITSIETCRIGEFLAFINTPEEQINAIMSNIKKIGIKRAKERELSPLINYLVIENEINKLFDDNITEEDFLLFFPIYFWVNITFVLPLRATEMMVTPYDCIDIEEDEIVLHVRRTLLKGGGNRVYYDVEKDYGIFSYHLKDIINRKVFDNIQKYRELTKEHERRFLFDYGSACSNEMLSLVAFNNLIQIFMDEYVIDNPKYEFAKKVSAIEEFEYVTAGDSRPIAMANLYFQDAGADICSQLANHMKITTSESYFTNVSETLYCSSIMQMQNRMNKDSSDDVREVRSNIVLVDEFGCMSTKRVSDKSNIEDCKGHYEDCFGCKYFFPREEQIEKYKKSRKEEFEKNVKIMQNVLNSVNKIKGKDVDVDELFLKVHTTSTRYKESTDVFVEREAKKWEEQQNTQKIYC